jgi:hypothetical protein
VKKLKITEKDYIKAARRAAREAEIALHGRPARRGGHVHRSERAYDRRKAKAAAREELP